MKVTVLFFGVLTDVAGTGVKICIDTPDLNTLKIRVFDDYPEMAHYSFRVAVNGVMADENIKLSDGDEVAFLPPFAGG